MRVSHPSCRARTENEPCKLHASGATVQELVSWHTKVEVAPSEVLTDLDWAFLRQGLQRCAVCSGRGCHTDRNLRGSQLLVCKSCLRGSALAMQHLVCKGD